MNILIPMVGLGQRFRNAGYETPKPLLDVDGLPMVARVVHDLPRADRLVAVINQEHIEHDAIDEKLKQHLPNIEFVVAPTLTDGQASSVQLGLSAFTADSTVLIVACDNSHLFDEEKFTQLINNPEIDGLIWTYRGEPRVYENPNWYGWVEVEDGDRVKSVSVKKPISSTLLNDHVVSGSFWFRSTRVLNEAIEELKRQDRRVNGELYLDSVPEILIERGQRIQVFEVDKYIGWGTPHDYEDYHRWSKYVRQTLA